MKKLSAALAGLVAVGLSASALVSCSKPKPVSGADVAPPPTAVATPVPEATPVPVPPEPPVKVMPGTTTGPKAEEALRGYLKDVFFDFDRSELRPSDKEILAKNADWLNRREYASFKVVIEGHADERGTASYNMALGERRASATRDFLVSLGLDASRIQVISYGKERPFSQGHDESAWTQNRRAHFVVSR